MVLFLSEVLNAQPTTSTVVAFDPDRAANPELCRSDLPDPHWADWDFWRMKALADSVVGDKSASSKSFGIAKHSLD